MMPRKLTASLARQVASWLAENPNVAQSFAPYLPRDLTAERASQIAAYLERAGGYYLRGLADAVA
jgi:hypothetical protein